jgi:hypothetical protein
MSSPKTLPKRTLQELLAIRELETELHDVVVEGTSDKKLIDWFLEENQRSKAAVYEIDVFQVDSADVLALGLENNNRGRVITLANQITSQAVSRDNFTCIADRDFDHILNIRRDSDVLLFTDYSCMLMYTYNERVLRKFFRFKVDGFPKSVRQIMREISSALQVLFAFHLTRHLHFPEAEPVPWKKSCSIDENGIVFEADEYVERYLHKNRRHDDKDRFMQQVRQYQARMRFDPRMQIRGHDFIAILIWYVAQHRGFKPFGRVTEAELEQDLFSCLEVRDLTPERLFQRLLERVPR